MTSNSPLGTLDVFPREIRNYIYGHVFAKVYTVFRLRPAAGSQALRHQDAKNVLSILCTSKAVHAEAASVLFTYSSFKFSTNLCTDQPHLGWTDIPSISQTDRMRRVIVNYDVWSKIDPYTPEDSPIRLLNRDHQRMKIFDTFAGSRVLRDTFRLEIFWSPEDTSFDKQDAEMSAIVRPLRSFVGFERGTVAMTLYEMIFEEEEAGISTRPLPAYAQEDIKAISNEPEPFLGKATVNVERSNGYILRDVKDSIRDIEAHKGISGTCDCFGPAGVDQNVAFKPFFAWYISFDFRPTEFVANSNGSIGEPVN